MGHEKFFAGILVLFAALGLMWLFGTVLDEVGNHSNTAMTGAVLVLAHGTIALGLIGLAISAWSTERLCADRMGRHVLLVLAGLLVINGNWAIAVASAVLAGVLVWHQLRTAPVAEADAPAAAIDPPATGTEARDESTVE